MHGETENVDIETNKELSGFMQVVEIMTCDGGTMTSSHKPGVGQLVVELLYHSLIACEILN